MIIKCYGCQMGLSIHVTLIYASVDMYQRTQDKPSVLVTSPGSPEIMAPVRHRVQHARLAPANPNVGGRLQVFFLIIRFLLFISWRIVKVITSTALVKFQFQHGRKKCKSLEIV